MTTGSNSPSKTKIKVCTTLIFAILDNSCHYKCHLGVARTILCFHCHAIKDKNANHSVQKVQNKDKDTNSVAKIQVCATFHMQHIHKNVLTIVLKFCMEAPCWCLFEGHKYSHCKPTVKSVFGFSYKCVNPSLDQLMKIKVMFVQRQGIFR